MKNSKLKNYKDLTFPNLFLINKQLLKSKSCKNLGIKEKLALDFIENIITNKKSAVFLKNYIKNDSTSFKNMLKWILETGESCYLENRSYDEVLDMASILLAKEFKDEYALSSIADLIFIKHSKNLLIHDLVWGFFESHNIKTLFLIADKLKSSNNTDFDLACKLLNLQLFDELIEIDKNKLYTSFIEWLNRNKNFIYFTGESFQQKTNPIIFTINHEAKYLCRKVKIENGEFYDSLSDFETKLLQNYHLVDFNTRILLENYSTEQHNKNSSHWRSWISYPITQQIQIALLGGYHDLYIE